MIARMQMVVKWQIMPRRTCDGLSNNFLPGA